MNSREAFEQVILANGGLVDRDSSGAYFERDVDISWLAWQAATDRAATICDSQHDRALTSSGAHRADCCAVRIREGND